MIGILARSQTSLAIKVSALAKQPWIADNLLPVIRPVGLGTGHGGIALHIGDDEVELRAAERLMPPASLDHLDAALPWRRSRRRSAPCCRLWDRAHRY